MHINALDKITSAASAEKESQMNKKHLKKQQEMVARPAEKKPATKPGRVKRVAQWVRALFAKALEKGRRALAWAKEKVRKAYGYCSVKAKAAMNYLAAKLKTVKAAAKRYALALNAKLGSPYETVVRGVKTYIVPVVSALRAQVRVTAMFLVPVAVLVGAVVAPLATGAALSLGVLGTLVYRHYGKKMGKGAAIIRKVLYVAGKTVGYIVEVGTVTVLVATMMVAGLGEALTLGTAIGIGAALQYEAAEYDGLVERANASHLASRKEAAQDEDDAPFDPAFPNLGVRAATGA